MEVIGLVASTPVPSLMYLQDSVNDYSTICIHVNHGGEFAQVGMKQIDFDIAHKAASLNSARHNFQNGKLCQSGRNDESVRQETRQAMILGSKAHEYRRKQ